MKVNCENWKYHLYDACTKKGCHILAGFGCSEQIPIDEPTIGKELKIKDNFEIAKGAIELLDKCNKELEELNNAILWGHNEESCGYHDGRKGTFEELAEKLIRIIYESDWYMDKPKRIEK